MKNTCLPSIIEKQARWDRTRNSMSHRGMVPEKNSKSEQQSFYVGKK